MRPNHQLLGVPALLSVSFTLLFASSEVGHIVMILSHSNDLSVRSFVPSDDRRRGLPLDIVQPIAPSSQNM